MTIFGFNSADRQERRAQRDAETLARPPSVPSSQPAKGTSGRPSSDRLARLEAKVNRLASRVDELEERQDAQEVWNGECKTYIKGRAAQTGPCPGCGSTAPGHAASVMCYREMTDEEMAADPVVLKSPESD